MSKQINVYQCEHCAGIIMPTRLVLLARMSIELVSTKEKHTIVSNNIYSDVDNHSFCNYICLGFFIKSRIDKRDAKPGINSNNEQDDITKDCDDDE